MKRTPQTPVVKRYVVELDVRTITALADGNDVRLGSIAPGVLLTLRRSDAAKTSNQRPKTGDQLRQAALT